MDSEQKYQLLLARKKENKLQSLRRMQKSNPEHIKRDCLREIRLSNQKLNCVRYNLGKEGNSVRHEIVKALVCLEIAKLGHEYISEAIFLGGKRADAIDLNEGIIYEVLYSETEEEAKEKVKSYPSIFYVKTINAKLKFKPEMMFD